MNEHEIETGERFLVDRVAFFLSKQGDWSPRTNIENCNPNYAIIRLEEYALHLFRDNQSDFELTPQLALGLPKAIKAAGHLGSLCYVLADEGAK